MKDFLNSCKGAIYVVTGGKRLKQKEKFATLLTLTATHFTSQDILLRQKRFV